MTSRVIGFLMMVLAGAPACRTLGTQPGEINLHTVAPRMPAIVIASFHGCLLSNGVAQGDLDSGKVKGTFKLTYHSAPFDKSEPPFEQSFNKFIVPDIFTVNFTSADKHTREVAKVCALHAVGEAKDSFNQLGQGRIDIDEAVKESTPGVVEGEIFPVAGVRDSQAGVTHEIKTELKFAGENPKGFNYLIKSFDVKNPNPWQADTVEISFPKMESML